VFDADPVDLRGGKETRIDAVAEEFSRLYNEWISMFDIVSRIAVAIKYPEVAPTDYDSCVVKSAGNMHWHDHLPVGRLELANGSQDTRLEPI
jgi:hypothetical protein